MKFPRHRVLCKKILEIEPAYRPALEILVNIALSERKIDKALTLG